MTLVTKSLNSYYLTRIKQPYPENNFYCRPNCIFIILQLTSEIIFVIIVWRITHLIYAEDGPFDLIIKLRKLLGNSFLGKLMDCFYCLSIWLGLACAFYAGNGVIEIIMLAIFYSGASILLEKLTNKKFI